MESQHDGSASAGAGRADEAGDIATASVTRQAGVRRPVSAARPLGRAARGAAREDEHRRPAAAPGRPASWKDVLLRIYDNISKDRIIVIAAGVTFYSLLAIFPAIAALVSLYGLFADPSTMAGHLDTLSGVAPSGAIDVIRDEMNRLAAQGRGKLGLTFIGGLAVSLWSANAGVKALFDALNLVYNEDEKRGLVRLNVQSLAFTTGAILFVLLAIGAMVVVPLVLDYVGLAESTALLVKVLRWPVLFVLVAIGLAVLYHYGPSRSRAPRHWITWGSAFAAFAWLGMSVLFSWYAENFASYNKTYGSLGAVIGFMVWLWLSIVVVLLGAELDAALEGRTARAGEGDMAPEARGARMGDDPGPSRC
jgi:membrane protein